MEFNEVRRIATYFLKRPLQKDGAPVRIDKTYEGWEVQFGAIEPTVCIRTLGIPASVRGRFLDVITLGGGLQTLSGERLASGTESARASSRTA